MRPCKNVAADILKIGVGYGLRLATFYRNGVNGNDQS